MKTEQLSILILDDEQALCEGLQALLTMHGHKAFIANAPSKAFSIMDKYRVDILLLDLSLPEMNGLQVMTEVRSKYPEIEVIIVTGHGDLKSSISALRAGATDFITKPFSSAEIAHAIERTRKFAGLNENVRLLKKRNYLLAKELSSKGCPALIGKSAAIEETISMMHCVASAEGTTVLVSGESGTGKELVARGIHALSSTNNNYFHSVNCAAIPEALFESEFFGHRKGAFTDAGQTLEGWFEISNNGTLFLDEISSLPMTIQAKFLRVLDQKVISKLGSHKEIALDLRVIAATNQDLATMVAEKTFRNDLYHRINTFCIHLPALRDRKEDIPLLASHFVNCFNEKLGKNFKGIDAQALDYLMKYEFPGNVRELKNMIERATILGRNGILTKKDFPANLKNQGCQLNGNFQETLNLAKIEKETVNEAIRRCSNNKTKAARLLGISRQALDRKLRSLILN